MKKPRSYAVFKDEHEEDLLYFERDELGVYILATKSGIYRYWPEKNILEETHYRHYCSNFERVGPRSSKQTDEIKYVMIDERIPYDYRFYKDGTYLCGTVLAIPDASEEKIKKLALEDMEFTFRKG